MAGLCEPDQLHTPRRPDIRVTSAVYPMRNRVRRGVSASFLLPFKLAFWGPCIALGKPLADALNANPQHSKCKFRPSTVDPLALDGPVETTQYASGASEYKGHSQNSADDSV